MKQRDLKRQHRQHHRGQKSYRNPRRSPEVPFDAAHHCQAHDLEQQDDHDSDRDVTGSAEHWHHRNEQREERRDAGCQSHTEQMTAPGGDRAVGDASRPLRPRATSLFRFQVVGGDTRVSPPRNLQGIVVRWSFGTRASRAPRPWLTLLAQGHYPDVFRVSMATGVPVRFRNDKTESIPHIWSISRVRGTPAPTVCAACESVPVVIRRPPASVYHLTIAGPGMLVFGRWRIPDVLLSNATPFPIIRLNNSISRSRYCSG